ncbi:MAG: phosphoenolpyruvate synthase [Candidatus Methanoperedens sp.]|nr:phosphoenolpyruvate synthase [Candidatus Methanoperedens sp. BLZ2]KAB2948263.1 MAG: phosphoenolpyruvate synthase [Candidatus Methanoperedens sp.]MBZ0174811.1 phosphoenolpyruvate synthase [Candidatus Methanoperedens nitroreducens]MCX9076964.1 phosphoenolpyruvate synthase [Candidatus Methanoperedens sp.]MCX9088042.1 phosphoenolpyruvate synthase [Candidatus Methanoperedens sp.]
MTEDSVVWLEEVGKEDIAIVGGKGASLGEMLRAELPVPTGFAVTAQAFRRFIDETGINDELFGSLEVDVDNADILRNAEKKAKKIIMDAKMPLDIENSIRSKYREMCKKENEEVFVAVRSSATAEDLPDASFAGQQDTFLNMRGEQNIIDAVKKCWASLYGARAIYYRVKQGFDHRKVNLCAVVQMMVDAEKAGVMFSSHPSSGEPLTIIEGAWGLGETVVSGSVSPDYYMVDRNSKTIKERKVATKNIMHTKDPKTGKTIDLPVPSDKKNAKVLDDDEILKLVEFGELLEDLYGIPQDIEWAIKNKEIFILQSRPITTIKKKEPKEKAATTAILEGLGASPGIAYGQAKLIVDSSELGKVKDGDILVAVMTTPDMVPAMKRAAAIVTDEGGLTCHAAIVSRELGCPAVVGTRKATEILTDGMKITVDGEKGLVFEGKKEIAVPEAAQKEKSVISFAKSKPVTATEVKVNVSIPEATARAVETQADGVGLLRIEHMILGLPKHPKQYIKEGKADEYVEELVSRIQTVVDAFYPKPVWVRTLDAPTDEFRAMEGGEGEPIEPNPMLGYRGIRRDLIDTEHFELEVRAFKELIKRGYNNMGIMIPLVQHPSELRRAKEFMRNNGLDIDKIDIGIMVEIPAAALIIDQFLAEGLNFVSFGTNDLTQYTLAVDRNNEHVAHLYNELHPAIMKLIEHVIIECNKAGVKTSICGQAGSNPRVAKRLVELGITSISANIDAVETVRDMVARTEMQLLLKGAREKKNS